MRVGKTAFKRVRTKSSFVFCNSDTISYLNVPILGQVTDFTAFFETAASSTKAGLDSICINLYELPIDSKRLKTKMVAQYMQRLVRMVHGLD